MTQQTRESSDASITFGSRLQSAREELNLDTTDVACQLRLKESIITMLEKDMYSDDIPITFLRGYLRSYAKFLDIPEEEINSALKLEVFNPTHLTEQNVSNTIEPVKPSTPPVLLILSKNGIKFFKHYFMHLFTAIVLFTLFALVFSWWQHHKIKILPTQQATLETPQATVEALPQMVENTVNRTTPANLERPKAMKAFSANHSVHVVDIYND